jgi:hypothetical protein
MMKKLVPHYNYISYVYYVASCYKSVADSEDLATDSGALITSM